MRAHVGVALGTGLILFAAGAFAGDEEAHGHKGRHNLIQNSSFENGNDELPDAWTRDAFIYRAELFSWSDEEAFSGCRSVMIYAPPGQPNDARWIQQAPVEPNTTYRLSGWIKTEGVERSGQAVQAGANLSILDQDLTETVFARAGDLLGDNDWTYVEMTFNSRQKTAITVAARLGFYSGTTSGTAWFDKIKLVRVEPDP